MMLEDRDGLGSAALGKAAHDLVAEANKDPTSRAYSRSITQARRRFTPISIA